MSVTLPPADAASIRVDTLRQLDEALQPLIVEADKQNLVLLAYILGVARLEIEDKLRGSDGKEFEKERTVQGN